MKPTKSWNGGPLHWFLPSWQLLKNYNNLYIDRLTVKRPDLRAGLTSTRRRCTTRRPRSSSFARRSWTETLATSDTFLRSESCPRIFPGFCIFTVFALIPRDLSKIIYRFGSVIPPFSSPWRKEGLTWAGYTVGTSRKKMCKYFIGQKIIF